jgi:hypothetical protein
LPNIPSALVHLKRRPRFSNKQTNKQTVYFQLKQMVSNTWGEMAGIQEECGSYRVDA